MKKFLLVAALSTLFITPAMNQYRYPPFEVDGKFDDWKRLGGCSSSRDTLNDVKPSDNNYPWSVDLFSAGMCDDTAWRKFMGSFCIQRGHMMSDSIWTCYEYYFDNYHRCTISDTSKDPKDNPGDSNAFWHDLGGHGYFKPDYRFRFCGKSQQILEERFQYWDGEKWVGEAMADDPRLEAAFSDTLKMEWSFFNADSLGMYAAWPKHENYRLAYAGHAWQGNFWDISEIGFIIIGEITEAHQESWKTLKSQ